MKQGFHFNINHYISSFFQGKRVKINGHIVNQRILMITDGYPTDSHDKDACQGTDYETNGIKVLI